SDGALALARRLPVRSAPEQGPVPAHAKSVPGHGRTTGSAPRPGIQRHAGERDHGLSICRPRHHLPGGSMPVTEVVKRYRLHLAEDEEPTGVWHDDGGRVVPGEYA